VIEMTGNKEEYYQVPVNYEIGFPQTIFTEINNEFFSFTYRFNSYDDSLIVTWRRASDGAVIWRGKVAKNYEHIVKDPTYGIQMVYLVASEVEEDNIELLIWTPWLS